MRTKLKQDRLKENIDFSRKSWCVTLEDFSYGRAERLGVPQLQTKFNQTCLVKVHVFNHISAVFVCGRMPIMSC